MNWRIAHLLACLLTALALVSGFAVSAEAQDINSLKEKMFGKRLDDGRVKAMPKVAHFVSEDGESFVFDESQAIPFLRFDGDDEIWALSATPGTKGDIIYKNDIGEPMLKATRWGSMTLFSDDRPMGDPAALTGKAEAFQPSHIDPGSLWLDLARASRRVSQALQRVIPFDAPVVTPETTALYADAIDVTSVAIVRASLQSHGKAAVDGVREVHFVDGRPPSARMEKGVLILKLDPSRGAWGGHVSSKRVVNILLTSYSIADDRR